MNQEILCSWLGLPKTAWPPDAWTLLGLTRGEHDLPVIEARVQDRMATLRHYQLSFPEEATEGMNRLAEAFVTLTEACSKKQAAEAIASSPTKPAHAAALAKDETSVSKNTKVDWRHEPPPVRHESASSHELVVEDETAPDRVLVSKPFVAPAKPFRRDIDPVLARELAEESDEATSSLGTLEAVILRVERTRRLLQAWEKIGKLLKAPSKKNSAKESEQFAKRLAAIADVMQDYPAFVGHPGKPGYRVVVHARLKLPLSIVWAMTPEHRDELLFDWQAGYEVMLVHRKFLRRLFKSMRHRTTVESILHAVRAAMNDYPRLTLIGVALVLALALIGAVMLAH
jgi:hypothetical protein